jgi:hypothetical protein
VELSNTLKYFNLTGVVISLVVLCDSLGCCPLLYYESIKRESKTRPINECRCDERLKTKDEESTRLVYTGFLGEREHLKIKTRLIDEKFASVMGECFKLCGERCVTEVQESTGRMRKVNSFSCKKAERE